MSRVGQRPRSRETGLYGPIENWMRRPVIFVDPEDSLQQVAAAMTGNDTGAVVVLGPSGPDVIITESDVVRALAEGGDSAHCWAGQIGTADLIAAHAGDRALEVANAMLFHGIQHVVVREGSAVIGLVCAWDLLSAAAASLAESA